MRTGLAVLLTLIAAPASAEPETYHSLKFAVVSRADCTHADLRDSTEYRCENDKTIWYFTKPKNAAHPGVVKFFFVDTPKGGEIKEQVWTADAHKPAFEHWRAALAAKNK
jgi:hypothetical protein